MITGARLVILGKQGAGKGTQCARLAQHYGVPNISTGDMFRMTLKANTEFSEKLRTFMDAGELVPDDLTIEMVQRRVEQDGLKERGFIFDGFPRTTEQAEALSAMLAPDDVDMVVDIEVPSDVALIRLAGRRVCEECGTNYGSDNLPTVDWICDNCGGKVVQRADDKDGVIARRLALYEEQTEPIISWYLSRDMLVTVDGVGGLDEVTGRLTRAIDSRLARNRQSINNLS